MQRSIQRWKACTVIVSANSNSDSAGIAPEARWPEETIGPRSSEGCIGAFIERARGNPLL